MKRSEIIFTALLIPLDAGLILAAFILAYWFRGAVEVPPVIYMWPFSQYLSFIAIFLPVWAAIFGLEGLYNIKQPKRGFEEILSIFLAVSAGMALVVLGLFFSRFLFFSRLVMIYAWVLAFVLVILGRLFFRLIQNLFYKRGIGVKRAIVIGTTETAKRIALEIKRNPSLGYVLTKQVDRDGIEKLDKIFERTKADTVVVAEPNLPESEIQKIVSFCEEKRLGFKMLPNFLRARITEIEINSFSPYPLVVLKITPLEGWGRVFKRIFDTLVAVLLLLVLFPLFLILAIMIKLDSKGPVFFKHRRIGSQNKEFDLYKFRSMIEEAPHIYHQLAKKKGLFFSKIEGDPRITRLGRFLRRSNLDELPQLFNVLKGEMSLVGPRPLTPQEFNQVTNYEKKYRWVSYVKPGITGLWQVSRRDKISDEERLALDIYYVERWSPLLDLWILFKTPLAVIKTKEGV